MKSTLEAMQIEMSILLNLFMSHVVCPMILGRSQIHCDEWPT
jgi:hypothetical protein